jgi:hypothetical protein
MTAPGPPRPPRRWIWRLGTLAFVIALAVPLLGSARQVIGAVTGSGGGDRPEPCLPGAAVPILPSPHIAQSDEMAVVYNSLPPTSGPHSAFAVASGIYDSPIRDALAVHALEHGHVLIQYASSLAPADVSALAGVARRYPADVVLAPYPRLTSGIALTAWGRIYLLDRLDLTRVEGFVRALRNRYNHGWTRAADC